MGGGLVCDGSVGGMEVGSMREREKYSFVFFFLRIGRPPGSTLCPYTTLVRSATEFEDE